MKALWLLLTVVVMCLPSCAENLREAPTDTIAKATKTEPTTDGKGTIWRSPELKASHYRAAIGGYNTLEYGLAAIQPTPGAPVTYELWFNSHNGGNARHYVIIRYPDGSRHPLQNLKHSTERCQEFSNLTNACLYHDSGTVGLSKEDLENAKNIGMKLTLSSGEEDYEQLELPAHYVLGFLEAVH